MLKNILITANVIALLIVLYFLNSGFYHWDRQGFWHEFKVFDGFVFFLVCAIGLPIALALSTKKFLWLVQTVVIVGVWCFWKTDVMQRTVFRNQPCSLAREMALTEDSINKYAPEFDSIAKAKEAELKLKSNVPVYYTDKPGEYTVYHASYREGKIYHLYIKDIMPSLKNRLHHEARVYYFPNGINEYEEINQFALPYNTRLFALDYDKFYQFNNKYIVAFGAIAYNRKKE